MTQLSLTNVKYPVCDLQSNFLQYIWCVNHIQCKDDYGACRRSFRGDHLMYASICKESFELTLQVPASTSQEHQLHKQYQGK